MLCGAILYFDHAGRLLASGACALAPGGDAQLRGPFTLSAAAQAALAQTRARTRTRTPFLTLTLTLTLALTLALALTLTPTLALTRTHTPDRTHRATDRVPGWCGLCDVGSSGLRTVHCVRSVGPARAVTSVLTVSRASHVRYAGEWRHHPLCGCACGLCGEVFILLSLSALATAFEFYHVTLRLNLRPITKRYKH